MLILGLLFLNILFSISTWERCFTYLTLGYVLFFTMCKPWLNSILCCTCTIDSSMASSFLLHPCSLSPLSLVIFMSLPRCLLWTYPLKPPLFQPGLRVVCYLSLPWLLSPLVTLQVLSQLHPLSCFYLLLHLTFIISQYLPSCLSCTCILKPSLSYFSLRVWFCLSRPWLFPLPCRFANLALALSFVVLMLLFFSSSFNNLRE
jgi:hypothetical protein